MLILHDLCHTLKVSFELPLASLPNLLSLPPHFELGLEIGEALSDKFDVQDARHTILILRKRLKFVLKAINVKLDIIGEPRPWTNLRLA